MFERFLKILIKVWYILFDFAGGTDSATELLNFLFQELSSINIADVLKLRGVIPVTDIITHKSG